jgi:20S proteasome alpha/beta subunit
MMNLSELQTLKAVDGGMGLSAEEIMDPMTDGTTIIAIKYKGGILLGADGRSATVSGYFLNVREGLDCGKQGVRQT